RQVSEPKTGRTSSADDAPSNVRLWPKPDIGECAAHVRNWPKADISRLTATCQAALGGEICGHDCDHRNVAHTGRAVCAAAGVCLPAGLPRRPERIRELARAHRGRGAGETCDRHADLSLPTW